MALKFNRTKTRREAISWMLMLAFLSLTLFPSHYHFHRVADASVPAPEGHARTTDVHVHTALDALDHHEDGHVIKSVADVPLKVQGGKLSWVFALMVFLPLLPFVARLTRLHPQSLVHRLPRSRRHNIPPTRAPPRA
jgi:hypothetical protein